MLTMRIVIRNMKSRDQMLIEKIGNNILKKIPGCENHFLGGTGQIRESLEQKNNHPSPHNPEVRPSHSRSQHLPPQTGPRSTHSSHDFRPCSSNASTIPQYPQQCQRTSYNSGPPVPARLPPQGPNQHQAGHQHQQSASTLGQQSFEWKWKKLSTWILEMYFYFYFHYLFLTLSVIRFCFLICTSSLTNCMTGTFFFFAFDIYFSIYNYYTPLYVCDLLRQKSHTLP